MDCSNGRLGKKETKDKKGVTADTPEKKTKAKRTRHTPGVDHACQ
ncbi:hypothetical protein NCLIV_011520 [Neospora caninum Liverpool]|uniref:Uncharacterized protein n=1 Tax=Neospora caninum (strain Liverpool) TaxID=572307 RepID=F0VAJ7_NEOCL|nr:hypothetical protein NCLIV_011520 [Neospora caninum Liverpool]CBZ50686.1 hypothetical protein NCLIV_011520 [Neospora caninum Liverpool]|eukprot:XP_003880719.1 hypothetical protein NCLIV_011520 [Neospora caninum Liverpool]